MNNVVVIVGHPKLIDGSLANKIIVEELRLSTKAEIRVLADMYPSFEIDVDAEQQALLRADVVVLQFPFYWYSVPGILKEWIDRVLSYGFAYGSTGTKLHGKRFVLSFTIGGPRSSYRREGYNTYEIDELLAPLKQTANLCGMVLEDPIFTHDMVYIEGVYNVKEEVEQRAKDHAVRLIAKLQSPPS